MRDTTNGARRARAGWWTTLCGGTLYLAVVACATFVPQQGWDPNFGPVVPHDSFPADCSLCHTGGNWHTLRADFAFDHGKETGVPLEGAHANAGCLCCHNDRGPVEQFAAQGCAGCHADPHLGRLGRNCADCHDERTWYPREAIVLHDRTRFPLVGVHAAIACFACHPGAEVGNFAGADSSCHSCHQGDRTRSTDPDHVLLGFSLDCEQCHLPVSWQPARFAHPASFPLSNAHGGLLCSACHTTPNSYVGLSTDCVSCHSDDFVAATEPNHGAAGFATDCQDCHDTRRFAPSPWPHPSGFALTFAHAGRRCTECHQGQVYSGTSGDCASCHLPDYQATQNPNHASAGFGTDCAQCHGTSNWSGAVGHPMSFPLEHAHDRACTDCHTTPGTYTGLSPACASCHLDDYNSADDPNHAASGFSLDCTGCHGTVTWEGAMFTHPATFALTNSHNRACTDCHTTPGTYTGLATACASCHLTDYGNATDPPHASFGMSQQCQDCHSTTVWGSANWSHPFPTTGDHNVTCFECHNNAANRLLFSCTHCHDHRQSEMDDKHDEVSGYVWASPNCYACHPDGND